MNIAKAKKITDNLRFEANDILHFIEKQKQKIWQKSNKINKGKPFINKTFLLEKPKLKMIDKLKNQP